MDVIRHTEEIRNYIGNRETAVALGAFDGLHIGHREVIRAAVESGYTPVVFTFRDDPSERLSGDCRYLTTTEERLRIFESWGVEYVVMPDFADVASWPAERFLNLLRFALHARRVACGGDFRFGKFALGNVELLARSCAQRGAELRVIDTVRYKDETVSATRIRGAIERGEVEDAAAMLARPFGFCFEVVHGNHIGRTIGTPTINQHFPEHFILPRFGVYASAVHIGGKTYCGVTNVGVKPTVGSDRALSETWILDYSGNLYGKSLRLELLGFIRDEKKFPSLDALKAEIYANAEQAREIFAAYENAPGEKWQPEMPAWKVYYSGTLWGRRGKDRPGLELPVKKQFTWGENSWQIPAVYACAAGLVVDFLAEVEPEKIKSFLAKWPDANQRTLRGEERAQLEAENPLTPDFNAELKVNGKKLHRKHSSGVAWIPASCLPEGMENDGEMARVLRHYGLDSSRGWAFRRASFPWATKRRPVLRTVQLCLAQEPVFFAGPHFVTPGTERLELVHPLTGAHHTLTVVETEPQVMDFSKHPFEDDLAYPQHFTALSYTLTPDLPNRALVLSDCAEGDRPVEKKPKNGKKDQFLPEAKNDACVGIIGGADGPTAVFVGGVSKEPKLHAACSSLHFEPVKAVEWRTAFYEKTLEDIEIPLFEA